MNRYLKVFADRRMLTIFVLGFSSGLPLALTGATMQAWLTDAKIDIATVGFFSLVGYPYAIKFLWAPIIDSYRLPILGFLGLRRGWAALTQVGLIASLIGLSFVDPAAQLPLFALLAFIVAFFSASQDIVVDAYRTEIIAQESYGAGAGIYTTGYRVAMTFVSGGLALIIAQYWGWTVTYLVMAALATTGLIAILMSREPSVERKFKPLNLKESVISPFVEIFQRTGAMEIMLFVMIYKLSTLMATALMTKFFLDMGFTKAFIGSVTKSVGFGATILGTLVGGSLMMRFGLKRSLWVFGILQSLVGLTFYLLIHIATLDTGVRELGLTAIVFLDNLMMGMGTVALMSFMMTFCNKQFTGTQLALFTSLMAVSRVVLVAHAGVIIEKIGYEMFFLFTIPLCLPALLLLNRFDHWQTASTNIKGKIAKLDMTMILIFMVALLCLSSDPIFRWLGMADVGLTVVEVGAFGIILVVVTGLVKPYLGKRFQ